MTNEIVVNFNSGEMTPQTDARDDIEKYAGGCRQLDNMIPDQFGNATKRPGTELIVAGNGVACYYPIPPDTGKVRISTPQELQDVNNDLTEDYEVINNIDMVGFTWTPIGLSPLDPFTGTFDGNFFTISNLSYTSGNVDKGGLFSATNNCSIIQVVLKDIVIRGKAQLGGLVGFTSTLTFISDCHVDGITIISTRDFGGFKNLSQCGGMIGGFTGASAGNVQRSSVKNLSLRAERFATCGGFMGNLALGNYINCYAQGAFEAYDGDTPSTFSTGTSSFLGGFCGLETGVDYTNCYAAVVLPPDTIIFGAPPDEMGGCSGLQNAGTDYTSCYWDLDVSTYEFGSEGQQKAGLAGKTTGQMFSEATFVDWDFDDIWDIVENTSYPTLRTEWSEIERRKVCQPI